MIVTRSLKNFLNSNYRNINHKHLNKNVILNLNNARSLATPSQPQGMASQVDAGSGPLSSPKNLDNNAIVAPLG